MENIIGIKGEKTMENTIRKEILGFVVLSSSYGICDEQEAMRVAMTLMTEMNREEGDCFFDGSATDVALNIGDYIWKYCPAEYLKYFTIMRDEKEILRWRKEKRHRPSDRRGLYRLPNNGWGYMLVCDN